MNWDVIENVKSYMRATDTDISQWDEAGLTIVAIAAINAMRFLPPDAIPLAKEIHDKGMTGITFYGAWIGEVLGDND